MPDQTLAETILSEFPLLDGRALADAAWLSAFVPPLDKVEKEIVKPPPPLKPVAQGTGTEEDPPIEGGERGKIQDRGGPTGPSPTEPGPEGHEGRDSTPISSPGPAEPGNPSKGRRINAPAVSAIPNPLDISRSLRPFNKKVDSKTNLVLDEEETVRISADSQYISPVFRPAPARWLEVAIVFDDVPSMSVWKDTAAEFRRLLERQGAFRDVRAWSLDRDGALFPGLSSERGRSPGRSARELVDMSGQRLVLVMTDCVGERWHDGTMSKWLDPVLSTNPVAILQVLPPSLWDRTAIGDSQYWLSAATPLPLNRYLKAVAPPNPFLSSRAQPQPREVAGTPIPVVCLEPDSLKPLARMLVDGTEEVYGFVVAKPSKDSDDAADWGNPLAQESQEEPFNAVDAVDTLQQNFPEAYELARLLSGVPLSLPVMRMVQQTMMPEGTVTQMAEFLLSGLVEARPEAGEFEFRAADVNGQPYSVRKELNIRAGDALIQSVLEHLSKYIETMLGIKGGLTALLEYPGGEESLPPKALQFATVSNEVLRNLGYDVGRYVSHRPSAVLCAPTEDDRLIERLAQQLGAAGVNVHRLVTRRVDDLKEAVHQAESALRRGPVLLHFKDPEQSFLEETNSENLDDALANLLSNFRSPHWDRLFLTIDGPLPDYAREMILKGHGAGLAVIETLPSDSKQTMESYASSSSFIDNVIPLTARLTRAFAGDACRSRTGEITMADLHAYLDPLAERPLKSFSSVLAWYGPLPDVDLTGTLVVAIGDGPWPLLREFGARVEVLDFEEPENMPLTSLSFVAGPNPKPYSYRVFKRLLEASPYQFAIVYGSDSLIQEAPFNATASSPRDLLSALFAASKHPSSIVELENCSITGGAWAPDGSEFVVAGGKRVARINARNRVTSFPSPAAIAIAVGEEELIVGNSWGGPISVNRRTEHPARLEIHLSSPVADVAMAGKLFVACSASEGYIAYKRQDSGYRLVSRPNTLHAVSVAVHPDGEQYAVGTLNGELHVLPENKVLNFSSSVNALAWNRAGTCWAAALSDGRVVIGEDKGQTTLTQDGAVVAVSFSSDDRLLATLTENGRVQLWSCDAWIRTEAFNVGHAGFYGGAVFHPHKPILAIFREAGSSVVFHSVDTAVAAPPALDRPVSNYIAAIINNTGDWDFVERDVRLNETVLRSRGFAVNNLINLRGVELGDRLLEIVDACEPDDLLLIEILCRAWEDGERLVLQTLGGPYNLTHLQRLLHSKPHLRVVFLIDVRDEHVLELIADRFPHCAVLGGNLGVSSKLGHSTMPYLFAQALALGKPGDSLQALVSRLQNLPNPSDSPKAKSLSTFRLAGLEKLAIPPAAESEDPWTGKNILWVDDRPQSITSVVDLFTARGANTTYAIDTSQALSFLDLYRFDAVLTDMSRPGEPRAGYSFLEQLQNRGVSVPRVLFKTTNPWSYHKEVVARGGLGATGSAPELIEWLARAFRGESETDADIAAQAAGWSEYLARYLASGSSADMPEDWEVRVPSWIDRHEDSSHAGPVLRDWLLATESPADVRKSIPRWLGKFRDDLIAGEVLLAWLISTDDIVGIRPFCRPWMERRGELAQDILLTWYDRDDDSDVEDEIETALERYSRDELISSAERSWRGLPESEITIGQSSWRYKERPQERYRWSLFVDEPKEVLQSIRSVKYILHRTFPVPVRVVVNRATRFKLESEGYGPFEVRIIITFRNGQKAGATHYLQLEPQVS